MEKFDRFVAHWSRQKSYYREENENIARSNLKALRNIIETVIIIYIIAIFVTPFLFTKWHITKEYFYMLPILVIFGILGDVALRKDNQKASPYICLGFSLFFMVSIAIIDVVPYPNGIASFFPILIAIYPALFNFNSGISVLFTTVCEILFVLMVVNVKAHGTWRYDLFNSLVGVLCSYALSWIIVGLRLHEGNEKQILRYLGNIDKLTGVYNKGGFERIVSEKIAERETEYMSGLFMLDIDNFKHVNDEFGHNEGDRLLSMIGETLKSVFRSEDIVGRVGGDEFMVWVDNIYDEKIFEEKCEFIHRKFSEITYGNMHRVECSIGVSILKDEKIGFKELYQITDDTLYQAKIAGKNRHCVYKVKAEQELLSDKKYVAIADDLLVDREIIAECLKNEYPVIHAANGVELLSLLSRYQNKIGAVLLDLQMPQMDGYEVIKYMKSRELYSHIPIVVISVDHNSELEALELGADDMIGKPFDPEIVRLRVRNAFEKDNTAARIS